MICRTLLVAGALLGSAMAAEPTLEKRLVAERTFRTQRSVRPWAREARGRMTSAKLRQRVCATATLVEPAATVPIDTVKPPVNVAKKPVVAAP